MQELRSAALRAAPDPIPNLRPLRLGVLSNRLSTRNRKGMARLDELLATHPEIPQAFIADWARMPDALSSLLAEDPDAIVVNGGDGTVVGLLTELRRRALSRTPALVVLASGNTNMIAADVGPPGSPDRALQRLLAANAAGRGVERIERRTIRIDHEGEPTRYAFFVGAIGIVRAILLARRTLHPIGVNHGLANASAMVLAALRVLFGRSGEEHLLEPVPAELAFDAEPASLDRYSVLMASTLERLLFGATPFWGEGQGVLRATVVRGPAERPLMSLLPLLRGRPTPGMLRSGYLSRNANEITMRFDGPYVIDGEVLQASRDRPVRLSDGGRAAFLRC
jgi:Diacylglycerol kinase catalytic domain